MGARSRSGTAWSGNIAEHGYLGVEQPVGLPTEDPAHLGGLIVSVDITYDSNGDNLYEPDGWFNDPTAGSYSDEAPPDESYNVLLYLSPYTEMECPEELYFEAGPPTGAIDARKPHSSSATTPCYGFGMPDDPATATKDESTYYPIVIDLGVTGAGDMSCWSYCETPDMSASDCGSNSIASVTDNGDGTYTIILNHGIQGGTVATIQYNGGSYVEYFHHPANADGSGASNANDIVTVVDCLNMPGTCENFEADIDVSGAQAPNDIIEEIDLLNGAGAYEPWFNTNLPVNDGSCP